ncbi:MAG: DUF3822 family protein [Cyclobacteriaceae bacterium]|nr:DUF3822 family protein [Cyclobacteriaceae bacterium]
MQTITSFKQIRKIKDDRFEADNIHEYTLLLNVGARDLQTAVIQDSRLLYLEDYIFPAVSSPEDLLEALDELFEQHAFLNAGFWNDIRVSFKNQKYVQVPTSLFDDDLSSAYLQFNAHFNTRKEEVHHLTMPRSEAVTIFAVYSIFHNWLEQHYPKKQFRLFHQSAALIEGIMEYHKTRSDNPLYLYIDRFKFHIVYLDQNQLMYYNQFSIHNFQDYIKYIMMVMKTLNIDQKNSQVVLWGYIGNNSPHYHEFYKYIQNVSFGNRPSNLTFGYVFDEAQDHHYFDLYSISLL